VGREHFNRPRLERRPMTGQRALAALLAALALVLFPAPLLAQTETDTGTARTQVAFLERGSVANVADMDFGKIAQSNTPGTIVLSPEGSATCAITGGLIRTGVCRAARFSILGKRNNRFRIRENSGGTVTLNGPASATMTLTNITFAAVGMTSVNGANGWNLGNYRLDLNSGVGEFYLGGTLNVSAAQRPGVYTGVIAIDIQLN
jgi:hypothetical protein